MKQEMKSGTAVTSKCARIVFDLDGTLIDSAVEIRNVVNRLLELESREPITLEETRSFIGNGIGVFIQKVSAIRDLPVSEHARLVDVFMSEDERHTDLPDLYPGVMSTLQQLKSDGHKLGICTNKLLQPCHTLLSELQLQPLFDTVWGGDSLDVRKPEPAPLHAAFQALQKGAVDDTPMIYVGDSEVDAETAKRAGVPFVLFSEGYRKQSVENIPHAAVFSEYGTLRERIHIVLKQP